MNSTRLKVLLDSTYILPSFGIEVEGLTDNHIAKLREAKIKGKIEFYCSPVIWIEVLGKIWRESKHRKIEVEEIVERAVEALIKSEFYNWIKPSAEAIKLAFKLRKKGHKDNIDNILYATAATNKMIFLTMDEDLKNFLIKNNYEAKHLLNHIELLKQLEENSI
ncbi:MAG: PIN domain-containing protein [archaeon GB-1867-035]|nr:PIN domain-containing protein [Candidatus Culexmicrobium profundum]